MQRLESTNASDWKCLTGCEGGSRFRSRLLGPTQPDASQLGENNEASREFIRSPLEGPHGITAGTHRASADVFSPIDNPVVEHYARDIVDYWASATKKHKEVSG